MIFILIALRQLQNVHKSGLRVSTSAGYLFLLRMVEDDGTHNEYCKGKARFLKPGKRIQLDDWTWHALDLLSRDRMMDFQELADEAFSDLLKKHGRPTDLKITLRDSVKRNQSGLFPRRSHP